MPSRFLCKTDKNMKELLYVIVYAERELQGIFQTGKTPGIWDLLVTLEIIHPYSANTQQGCKLFKLFFDSGCPLTFEAGAHFSTIARYSDPANIRISLIH